MAKNKLTIDFSALEVYRKKLDAVGGDATKRAVESALKASQQIVKSAVTEAMSPHNQDGETADQIIRSTPVTWTGGKAEIPVGFLIPERNPAWNDSELASVFLMYGTKVHGQPHEAPDRKLYNAVYGTAIRKRVRAIQELAFRKVIERAMK